MPWSKPDFEEISLCMEVTGYVNTDEEEVGSGQWAMGSEEAVAPSVLTTDH